MIRNVLTVALLSSFLILTGCDDNSSNRTEDNIATETPTETPTPSPAPVSNLEQGYWGAEKLTMYVKNTYVDLQFACAEGRISGKIRPDANGNFRRVGTYSFFSNVSGENEKVPAVYTGIVNSDRSVITLTVTFNDPDDSSSESVRQDYVLRRNVQAPQSMCAFN